MNCEQARPWLGALLDGELDVRTSAELQAHLTSCTSCSGLYRADAALRAKLRDTGLHFEMRESLRDRVMRSFGPTPVERPASTPGRRRKGAVWVWRLLPWSGWVLAVAMSVLFLLNLQDRRADVRDELISLHVRSLLADHLSDVTSSDRHTVKPWFAGKLDFAPPVPDLGSRGFFLVGGRLDYLDGQKLAAVVYQRRAHVINVVIGVSDGSGKSAARALRTRLAVTHRGYSIRTWQATGLSFAAISDLNPEELGIFEQTYLSAVR